MNILIESSNINDINELLEIENSSFPDAWTYNMVKSELDNPHSYILCAKVNNKICGYAIIWHLVDCIEINKIAVEKIYRQKGIGSKLIDYILSLTKQFNVNKIILEVRNSNVTAITFYKSHGFDIIATRTGYYRNPTEDALIMSKQF